MATTLRVRAVDNGREYDQIVDDLVSIDEEGEILENVNVVGGIGKYSLFELVLLEDMEDTLVLPMLTLLGFEVVSETDPVATR